MHRYVKSLNLTSCRKQPLTRTDAWKCIVDAQNFRIPSVRYSVCCEASWLRLGISKRPSRRICSDFKNCPSVCCKKHKLHGRTHEKSSEMNVEAHKQTEKLINELVQEFGVDALWNRRTRDDELFIKLFPPYFDRDNLRKEVYTRLGNEFRLCRSTLYELIASNVFIRICFGKRKKGLCDQCCYLRN